MQVVGEGAEVVHVEVEVLESGSVFESFEAGETIVAAGKVNKCGTLCLQVHLLQPVAVQNQSFQGCRGVLHFQHCHCIASHIQLL